MCAGKCLYSKNIQFWVLFHWLTNFGDRSWKFNTAKTKSPVLDTILNQYNLTYVSLFCLPSSENLCWYPYQSAFYRYGQLTPHSNPTPRDTHCQLFATIYQCINSHGICNAKITKQTSVNTSMPGALHECLILHMLMCWAASNLGQKQLWCDVMRGFWIELWTNFELACALISYGRSYDIYSKKREMQIEFWWKKKTLRITIHRSLKK